MLSPLSRLLLPHRCALHATTLRGSLTTQTYHWQRSLATAPKFREEQALYYEERFGPVVFEPFAIEATRLAFEHVTKSVKTGNDVRVFEAACGTGRVTHHLLDTFSHASDVVATDLSEGMLNVAKTVLSKKHPHATNLTLNVADVCDLPYPDNHFDVAVFQFGMMFVEDKPKAIRELSRILKPGGVLIMSTWDAVERNLLFYEPKQFIASLESVVGVELDTEPFKIPFLMNDVQELEALMATDDLFENISINHTTLPAKAESPELLAEGLLLGSPTAATILEAIDYNEAKRNMIVKKLTNHLTEVFGNPLSTTMTALYSIANNK
eukprot:m.46229 g.46229  ORF g.46229 m.46229 type:complete len:324 (+) comp10716_c0_seq2:182-1153(+)